MMLKDRPLNVHGVNLQELEQSIVAHIAYIELKTRRK